jgi:hypothetical protein
MANNNWAITTRNRKIILIHMKILYYIILITTIVKGCGNMENNFIEKYENADFLIFYGFSVYKPVTPGFGKPRPVFFIEELNNPLQIRYVVELNADKTDVKEFHKVFIRDTITTDGVINNKEHLKAMALKFNEFNIYSIKVDSLKNVFVKQKAIEQDNQIARFENSKLIDANKWILIKGNWYLEK